MDWFLDPSHAEAARELRREFGNYLRRHGSEKSDFAAAELVLGELIANVAKHAQSTAWIEVDWSSERPVLSVHDLGTGFSAEKVQLPDETHVGGRGLFLVSQLGDDFAVRLKASRGAKVSAVLPVLRPTEKSFAPPQRNTHALPSKAEVADNGTFGKEFFLRALVVEIAQFVELEHGPDAAAAAVAQVGTDVGGRMEDEYRRARDIVEKLTPDQMGDLYVRLKWAIDGDFEVVEANERRIVLVNRRCPFGDVVSRAPTLCRMTSSVFGGIAARNANASAVQLVERIAVGDPGCKVIVWLGEAAQDELPGYAHSYSAPK